MLEYSRGSLVKIGDEIMVVYRDLGDTIEVVRKVSLCKSDLETHPKTAIVPFAEQEKKAIKLALFGHLIKTRKELNDVWGEIERT